MTQKLETKRKAWDIIFNDPNLSLNSLRHRAVAGNVCQNGLRSVCWKIFLGYLPTVQVSKWPSLQLEQRQHYTNLKRMYIEEPAEKMNKKGEQDLSDNNPLALSDSNPWQQYFADSEIRKVIRQDVERTFPDVDFFRENDVQQRLTDILFIYCKLNRDVSYRQGMHELLAPFYWILATESLDTSETDDPASELMLQVLDSAFVEHDAYILFDKLMTFGKSWYEFNEEVPNRKTANSNAKPDILSNNNVPKPTDSARLNPIVMTCHRIHHQYLATVDPFLYRHLESFGIEPQLYGIRWIRLLFGREFDMYELLKLWDAIFAQDPTLKIVEYACLVILLRMRDQLLQKDYAECLTLLMRPTQISEPASLVQQATYLQENLSEDTALHILQQNDVRSGKHPRNTMSDGVPEVSSVAAAYSGQQRQPHLQQRTLGHRSSRGFDSLSRITTNMMMNSPVRDLNRAIADVMKNVNNFGENVLGRPQDVVGPRRCSVSSEFPSSIDRIATTHKYEQRAPPIPLPKNNQDAAARLTTMNRSMGDMMAKCISLLENEIYPDPGVSEEKKKAIHPSNDDLQSETAQDYDDSNHSFVVEETKLTMKPSTQDDATIIMALAGLKHVRDVLLGKQTHFDSSVIDMKSNGSTPDGEEWKWDLVDHKEVITSTHSSPRQRPSPPTISTKRTSATIFVPPQTSSCLISANVDSPTFEKDIKPLPPVIQQQQQQQQQADLPVSPTAVEEHRLSLAPITYIPANPTPPKQQIKYRIEDLLSDPDLQLPSPKASANAKFKWMLENEHGPIDKPTSSSPCLNNSNNINHSNSSQDLFKSEQTLLSPRKRSSFITTKAASEKVNESSVDPLDARHVDNRKSCEYDLLQE